MRAKDVLLDALMKYTGTVVFVSHDRYFIDKLATRVFEVGDGKVEIFPGNYEDYLWRKQGGQHVAPSLDDVPDVVSSSKSDPPKTVASSAPSNGNGTSEPPSEAPKKRLNPMKRKQMEDRVRSLEEEIEHAEEAIARCEASLQSFVSVEETQRQSSELEAQKSNHAALVAEWEETSKELELSE
jgi:ATP-binding cassette subfamily F protein 3